MTRYERVGTRLEVSRAVGGDREAAWELLTDTRRWPEWGPSVRAVECDRRYIESGTEGRVRTPVGGVGFRVTECADYRWTWRVAGVPATGHRADAGPRAVFEVPLAAAAYAPVCALALRRIDRLLSD
ncbi:MAG: SRPBCC family protein [Halobacteriaceae archaeon]